MKEDRAVIDSYSRVAERYDERDNQESFWGRWTSTFCESVARDSGDYRTILEIGCGTGTGLALLAANVPSRTRIFGVEPAENMRRRAVEATRAFSNVTILDGRFEQLPIASGSIDYVFSTWAFHWVTDSNRAIAEISRVLSPSGEIDLVFVGDQNGRAFEEALRPVYGRYMTHEERVASAARVQRFDVGSVRRLFGAFPSERISVSEFSETHHATPEQHAAWRIRLDGHFDSIPAERRLAFESDIQTAISALAGDDGSVPYTLHGIRVRCRGGVGLVAVGRGNSIRERLARAAPDERRRILREVLADELADVLGPPHTADSLRADAPLWDLGLTSLGATALRSRIEAQLGRAVPISLLFKHSTLEKLGAFLEREQTSEDVSERPSAVHRRDRDEAIAIVGMGCRFPGGAHDPASFWRALDGGVDPITEVPKDRWDVDAHYDPDPDAPGKMQSRYGGFLEGTKLFDARFFGVSPREAERIDPQQRLLLEVGWEALEDAGVAAESLRGSRTGVYVGIVWHDYERIVFGGEVPDLHSLTGNATSVAAGRLSYTLGLEGPCVAVDTACSSSLVAIHLACQAIRAGECDMALAGGVNLILGPDSSRALNKAMSPDGRCRAFDATANGMVRSEGCGVLVLKRLSRAQADGDRILALVRGTAINQDGQSSGLTVPNGGAQEAVIESALGSAGIDADQIDFVECHGTGTILGDPIEVEALGAVLGRARQRPLRIGSVKSNIGHTEAAGGVASVIKTVLALEHEAIPANLHFSEPNPHISWSTLPVEVVAERAPWPKSGRPRLAGVSSFGISGTNAHVILEEAPAATRSEPKVAFLFAGAGSQYTGMGRALFERQPVFRRAIERCAEVLDPHLERPLLSVLYPEEANEVESARLDETVFAQAALFAVAVALAELWRSWGVVPDVVVGQSQGEVAAACVAGALSLEDAAHIVCRRSELLQRGRGHGVMAAVGLPEREVEARLAEYGDRLSIAIVNGPTATTVAGDLEAMDAFGSRLAAEGVFYRRIQVGYASHTKQIDALLGPDLVRAIAGIAPKAGKVPLYSTVVCQRLSGAELGPEYWRRNFGEPVRFATVITKLIDEGVRHFVEVSAHPVLGTAVASMLDASPDGVFVPSLQRGEDDAERIVRSAAALEAHGVRAVPRELDGEASSRTAELVTLSAKTEGALDEAAARLRAHLEAYPAPLAPSLRDVAFSLATTRTHHEHRLALVASSRETLLQRLTAAQRGETPFGVRRGSKLAKPGKLAWLFPGQGAQTLGMGRRLHAEWPVFRGALEEVCAALDAHLEEPLRDVMWAPGETARAAMLDETGYAQPALFALSVALSALWRSWGVEPAMMAGHSVGELSAACAAGVFSIPDGARLVAARARGMQALAGGGSMLSIAAPEVAVREAVRPHARHVSVAAVNSPASVVVSGEADAVAAIGEVFAARGVKIKRLRVSRAFHSHLMEPMLGDFARVAESVRFMAPRVPLASNVTGKLAGPEIATAAYWVEQIRTVVRFADCVESLSGAGVTRYTELGPSSTLLGLVYECLSEEQLDRGLLLPSLRPEQRSESDVVLLALGAHYAHGDTPEWGAVFPEGARRVALPTYPWQRERYWVDGPRALGRREHGAEHGEETGHPLLGVQVPMGAGVVYESVLSLTEHRWLADHQVRDQVLVPAAAIAELVRAAASAASGDGRAAVASLVLQAPIVLAEDAALRLQVTVSAADPREICVYSQPVGARPGENWTLHASAEARDTPLAPRLVGDLAALRARCGERVSVEEVYRTAAASGLVYGATFRGLRTLSRGDRESLAEVALPSDVEEVARYGVHPALLDASFHSLLGANASADEGGGLSIPFSIESMVVHEAGARAAIVHARTSDAGPAADVTLLDEHGRVLVEVRGLERRPLGRRASADRDAPYRLEWFAVPRSDGARRAGDRWAVVAREHAPLDEVPAAILPFPDVAAITDALDRGEAAPDVIVVVSFSAEASPAGEGSDVVTERARATTRRLVAELQAYLADPRLELVPLVVVTRRAVATGSDDGVLDLAAAPSWGLVRSAQSEHPARRLQLVDLDELAPGAPFRDVVAAALATREPQLASRRSALLAPRLRRDDAPAELAQTSFHSRSSVLITGGTGAIGALLARHLIGAYGVERVVLAARSRTAEAEALVSELAAGGAQVTLVRCDLADREEVRRLLAHPALAELSAIVHAAGVVQDAVVTSIDALSLDRTLGPKLDGALHLDELTQHLDLDAFVLFSSASGVLGTAGQGAYAAANAGLDALAHHRRAQGRKAVSLAWGPWDGAGLAARLSKVDRHRIERDGIRFLSAARALAMFDFALRSSGAVRIPVAVDDDVLRARAGELSSLWRALSPQRRPPAPREAPHPWRHLTTSSLAPPERFAALRERVAGEIATLLGFGRDDIDPRRPLQEIGLDSLLAVQLRNRLVALTGLRLQPTVVFDHPTPEALARFLERELFPDDTGPRALSSERITEPALSAASDDPVAIVSMACRFPGGVDSPEALWTLIEEGRDAISSFPSNRGWDLDRLFATDASRRGTSYSRHGGFLHDADRFDPSFFGIAPREALAIDPQHRLLLEVAWETIERAGIDPTSLMDSSTGVFAGIMYADYGARVKSPPADLEGYMGIGSAASVASGRVAYTLGLRGPSLTIDTACSSSLVALGLACRSLLAGECSFALCGGATVMATPSTFVQFSRQRGLAVDGRCKPFSADADGVGWSEGVALLGLERLSDARRLGHPVLALVRGFAVNQDGRSQGLTAPNGPSQELVIREALARSGLSAADIDVVEGHGTGTTLGDPIEANALFATYGREHSPLHPLWLGSVKSNIGHTQAAAGVAGIVKMVLAMERGILPRTLHAERPSPHVDWSSGAIRLLEEAVPWESRGRPRRAAVSSFGISGTNAHVILEEAPRLADPPSAHDSGVVAAAVAGVDRGTQREPLPFVLSAKTEASLRQQAARLRQHVDAHPDVALADLAHALVTTRAAFDHRAVALASEREDLVGALSALADGDADAHVLTGRGGRGERGAKLAIQFSGQGSQWPGMGRALYASFPTFRAALDEVCARFDQELDVPLRDVLFGAPAADQRALVHQTAFAQPALFAFEVALFRWFEACGVRPDLLVGHSIGEIVAAHVAGVFTLEAACRLVAARGRLIQAVSRRGAMIALQATEEEVRSLLHDRSTRVQIAAINAPAETVVSGDEDDALQIADEVARMGRRAKRLDVSHAFHSEHMSGVLEPLREVVRSLSFAEPRIRIVSSVTGRPVAAGELTSPDYWVEHVRATVRHSDAIRTVEREGAKVLLELGPRAVLSALAPESLAPESAISVVSSSRRDREETEALWLAAAGLHAAGIDVDWRRLVTSDGRKRASLPTYAFDRSRYWLDPSPDHDGVGDEAEHPLLGMRIALADGKTLFRSRTSLHDHPWLAGHKVLGRAIFPASGFVELALAAASRLGLGRIDELVLEAPLELSSTRVELEVAVGEPTPDGTRSLAIHARDAAPGAPERWTRHARGVLSESGAGLAGPTAWPPPPDAEVVDLEGFYEHLTPRGLDYGPLFRGLREVHRRGHEVFARVELPATEARDVRDAGSRAAYTLHPALLDAVFHALVAAEETDRSPLRLPFACQGVEVLDAGVALWAHLALDPSNASAAVTLADANGLLVGRIEKLTTRPALAAGATAPRTARDLFEVRWLPLAPASRLGEPVWSVVGGVVGPALARVATRRHADLDEAMRSEAAAIVVAGPRTKLASGAAELELRSALEETLSLVRAWLEGARPNDRRLLLVTRRAVATTGDEDILDLGQSAIWGAIRSAQVEHPQQLRIVDLDLDDPSPERWRDVLGSDEPELAVRGDALRVPRLVHAPAADEPALREPGEAIPPFDPGGTVLVTGGTGSLGSSVARHLVDKHGVRHLLLCSRTGHDPALEAELSALGATVRIAACDLSDRAATRRLLASVPEAHPLTSVIHAAGVLDDAVVTAIEPAQIDRVFAAKVAGAIHLDELVGETPLASFVLFSSLAGTTGSPGQATYAAANAVLDALAQRRRVRGRAATSIAWGYWDARSALTSRVGAADLARMARFGVQPLSMADGLALFDAIVTRGDSPPVQVAARLDMAAMRARVEGVLPLFEQLAGDGPRARERRARGEGGLRERLSSLDRGARVRALTVLVSARIAQTLALAVDAIEPDAPLSTLGVDSLMALDLRSSLSALTGLRLSATLLFDHPTAHALAVAIESRLFEAEAAVTTRASRAHAPADADPIAIVAMSCRFPAEIDTPESLWRFLAAGGDATSDFPVQRGWDVDALYDPDPDAIGKTVTRRGGFLHDADRFDAAFFGMSPREALATDPQQRLLLETSWEVLERAGIPPGSLKGSASGVFVGIMYSDYAARSLDSAAAVEGYLGTGSAPSIASGRIAYTFGLQGPAITVDTACSSSLVALHLGCQALRRGECSLVFAGGATMMSTPAAFVEFSRQRGLARDGRSKAFSTHADGVGWSEGAGMLLLERLSDARRNGHPVLALIRGSALNQDGRSQGLTAPNGPAQEALIRQALADAKLDPADIDVVEAHGTGTALGDPIEAQALFATYGSAHSAERPLWLGAIKSNLGHTQAAAGVAGIIKMVLSMQNGVLPKTLHVEQPSPLIDWSSGQVRLLAAPVAWERGERTRRAAVSSFGISGTNAHVILEEAGAAEERLPDPATTQPSSLPAPVLLSAQEPNALRVLAGRVLDAVEADALSLLDVAHTLANARARLDHRVAIVADDRANLVETLRRLAVGSPEAPVIVKRRPTARVALLFTGQGAQFASMGRQIYETFRGYRDAFDQICHELDPMLDVPLRSVLFADEDRLAARIHETRFTQPALFALEVALYHWLASCGVEADVLLGHSVGEIAAAHVAGVFDLPDACRLVATRARLIQALPDDGCMIAIEATEAEVRESLAAPESGGGRLGIAAVNGPRATVLSGDAAAANAVGAMFERRGRRTRRLVVSHAFHSPHIDAMQGEFRDEVATIRFSRARVPLISSVTGRLIEGDELASPEYWVNQVRATVRFADALRAARELGTTVFLEVGPQPALTSLAESCFPEETELSFLAPLRRGHAEARTALETVAHLHLLGRDVELGALFAEHGARTVTLPTYPFQRERYWLAPRSDASTTSDHRAGDRSAYQIIWKRLSVATPPDLEGQWLVVSRTPEDDGDLRAAVTTALRRRGATITEVSVGDGAAERPELARRFRAHPAARGVVSLVGLAKGARIGHPSVPAAVADTLAVLQALADADLDAPLWIVTRDAVRISAEEPARHVEGGAVWGLGRVIALEHPKRWGGLIDTETMDAASLGDALALALRAHPSEEEVALRRSGIWGRRLVPFAPDVDRPAWKPAGKVLITGGTGALGGHVGRWLAAAGASHLVLVSRRGERADGAEALVAELRDAGVIVRVEAVDISDAGACRAMVARVEDDAVPVRAVFHCAGSAQQSPLAELSLDTLEDVFRGKVAGAQALHEAFGARPLDAFVLFSSIAGVWGAAGQGAYASANALLDTLAESPILPGRATTAVAWGPWAGGGLVDDEYRDALEKRGLHAIAPEAGVGALSRVLAQRAASVVVADVDWKRFSSLFSSTHRRALFDDLPALASVSPRAPSATSERLSHLRAASPADRARRLLELVLEETAAALGHRDPSRVAPDSGFVDLGMDSLMAIDLRGRLNTKTGLSLPATLTFDHPTPRRAAAHLETALGLSEQAPAEPSRALATSEPVAIVGIGLHLPGGVVDLDGLWRVLSAGESTTSAIPERRFALGDLFDPDPDAPGKTYVRDASCFDRADLFDAEFFQIAPSEAENMDPQHRMLLETTWHALEDAGIVPGLLRDSKTGVFVGIGPSEYDALKSARQDDDAYSLQGTHPSFAAGRVAFTFGLQGPTLALDTACSSSLVALHLACQSLRHGESDLALAGGAHVFATPDSFIRLSRTHALAPDGRSKTFSADADGYGRGEGVIVLVLERLADAERNRHRVLGIVRGSAVNHDGASSGITAPNGIAQQKVLRAALHEANLTPDAVDFVECHGTGTPLGDPIEVQALAAVYGGDPPARERPLLLGAVKTIIGHLEAASGLAGVASVLTAFRHRLLPASLHTAPRNPHVDWANLPVRVVDAPTPWPTGDRPRRAGVSAFGLSGTNAHVLLEEPPNVKAEAAPSAGAAAVPLLLSAPSAAAVRVQAAELGRYLAEHPELGLLDVAFSLATTRAQFPHRAVIVGTDRSAVLAELDALSSGQPVAFHACARRSAKVAALFSGQGSQYAGMIAPLHARAPAFRDAIDEICAAFAGKLELSLRDILLAEDGSPEAERLHETRYAQPALFAVSVALYRLACSVGVRCELLLGHSIGELAAAHVAGVFDLDAACTVVAARGRLMHGVAAPGAMIAIEASEAEVRQAIERCAGAVDLASLNAPRSVVISGDEAQVVELAREFGARGRRTTRLRVGRAFHSSHMDPMLAEYRRIVAEVSRRPPTIPIVSNVTGLVATPEALTSVEYWVEQVRQPVQFEGAVRTLVEEGVDTFVELGPQGVLTGLVEQCLPNAAVDSASAVLVSAMRKDRDAAFVEALAALHVSGVAVDWATWFGPASPRRVALPAYVFQRESFEADRTRVHGTHGRRSADEAGNCRYQVVWRSIPAPAPGDAGGTWLVVLPERSAHDRAAEIVAALRARGGRVILARFGDDEDRLALAERLRASVATERVRGVISLLALQVDGTSAGPSTLASTVTLMQALGDAAPAAPLWLLTKGAMLVREGDHPREPSHAAVWGLGRVMNLEHPDRWGGAIDVDRWGDEAAERVLDVLLTNDHRETEIALRDGQLLARRLEHAPPASETPWRPRGTVLVVGAGAVGDRVAEWACRQGAERIVFLSRRGAAAPRAGALRDKLVALGADVVFLAGDVTDRAALATQIAILDQRGIAIDAWVFALGEAPSKPLADMSAADLEMALTGAWGAEHLDDLLSARALEARVFLTPTAFVWGAAHEGARSASGAWLQALVERRRALGARATLVAFSAWAGDEMADDALVERFRRWGLSPIRPALALRGLANAVGHDLASAVVASVDWDRFVASFAMARAIPLFAALADAEPALSRQRASTAGAHPELVRELTAMTPAARDTHLVKLVVTELERTLGKAWAETDLDTGFRDRGLDSIMSVELRNRISAKTGVRLPATATFDHPTPTALAKLLRIRLLGDDPSEASDAGDTAIREALARIPMAKLRSAGLLEPLLALARSGDPVDTSSLVALSEIDTMGAEDLIRLAVEGGDA